VVSSLNSITAIQAQLPPEITSEKKNRPKKCATNELDSQGVLKKLQKKPVGSRIVMPPSS